MTTEDTVARIYRLSEDIKALEAEVKELKATLPDAIDNYAYGPYLLKVERNARFDAVTARKALKPEQYEQILVPTPNADLAKRVLTGEQYALCQREYDDPKRTIVKMEG